MSRSNPTVNNPHPAQRWLEWDGANGVIRYYDKEINNPKDPAKKGANVTVAQPFTFLVLDETACVIGWHEPSGSKIYSNEVRDTREQPLLVKSFKGGVIANGLYASIKEKAVFAGAHYHTNVYLACKGATGALELVVLQLGGAALGAWMDFRKKAGKKLYEGAVFINGFTEGRKGAIVYRMPTFGMKDVTPATNDAAMKLDAEVLQPHLKEYFAKGVSNAAASDTTAGQSTPEGHEQEERRENTTEDPPDRQYREEPTAAAIEEDDIPF